MVSVDIGTEDGRVRLGRWLSERLGGRAVEVLSTSSPKSGFSAETLIVAAEVEGQGEQRFVVRREVSDPAVYPQQVPGLDIEIDIQFRTMERLHRHGDVPLAPLIGYEADAGVLGQPFFVMGFVGGEVPTENPMYTTSGFFVDATAEQRRRMIDNGLAQLAELHAIDWQVADFGWLRPTDAEPGTAQQLALWRRFADTELAGREHPVLATAFDWLPAHLPDDESIGLCWGDPRPGNIIWDDFVPACLTDFEAVSIASPIQDLGWWLMFDRTMHPDGGRADGDPSRDEQIAMYERHTGRPAIGVEYHQVFAAARYSAIVVRVMNRLEARGDLPAGHDIWLNNPASAVLAELLAEI